MKTSNPVGHRMLQIKNGIIGPRTPRQKTVIVRSVNDYPEVSKAHLEVAQIYADKKMAGGVPICDELIALDMSIRAGRSRRITMKNALEIKTEAESNGLVTWIDASDPKIGGTSCSCCGDCCHFMRRVSEFNVPASIAPPHFTPTFNPEKCNYCGKCAPACPMGAVTIDLVHRNYTLNAHRCIGCAQCTVACSQNMAIAMVAVADCEEFQQDKVGIFF